MHGQGQFVICIHWVNEALIGVYNVDTIDAKTLTTAIRNVLLWMSLKRSKCHGQCSDGASNMTGNKNGVATQLQAEESRAVLTHCYGHALNLAVGDAIKQSKICRDALDNAFEISKLINFYPKRNAALDCIRVDNHYGTEEDSDLSRSFCSTRWTVCGDALDSIIENYIALNTLWKSVWKHVLIQMSKAVLSGFRHKCQNTILFDLLLSMKILKITGNLSRILQNQDISAADYQSLAELTTATLKTMRREETSDLFHSSTVEEHFRQQYYEVIDTTTNSISSRFDQPGHAVYRNLERLLLDAANNMDYNNNFKEVISFYTDDLEPNVLSAQLQMFHTLFDHQKITLRECVSKLRVFSPGQRSFFCEVWRLAQFVLVMPATNAVSERSFSAMRRLKTYSRSIMSQARLNHVLLMHLHREKVDE